MSTDSPPTVELELEAVSQAAGVIDTLSDVLKDLAYKLRSLLENPTTPGHLPLDSIAFAMGALKIASDIHPNNEAVFRDVYHLLKTIAAQEGGLPVPPPNKEKRGSFLQ